MRKVSLFTIFLYFVILFIGFQFCYLSLKEAYTSIELKERISESNKVLKETDYENQKLNAQKDKLKNTDYIERYARSTYYLTKSDEILFFIQD